MRTFGVLRTVLLCVFVTAVSSCARLTIQPETPATQAGPGAASTSPIPQAASQSVPTAGPRLQGARPEAGPVSGGTGWNRVFTDEFSATAPDRSRWTDCYWWDDNGCTNLGNENQQWYTANNISVADSTLALTAREQSVRGIEGRLFPYTSGIVTTGRYYDERANSDRFAFTYGYVEVRARIPSGQGLWPAIWLLPSTQRPLPEIDIMEVLGHRPNVLEMHFHYADGSGERQTVNRAVRVDDLSQGYHVYGLEWSPSAMVWYLDGVERWRVTNTSIIPREPMYLIVNLAVGGTWPGAPNDATQFPAQFLIDYVRIWQRGQ